MIAIVYCLTLAFLNCARGRKLFDHTDSTVITRLFTTFGMALATGFLTFNDYRLFDIILLWTWASLMLWASLPWMKYLSAAIGSVIDATPAVRPIDWIMAKIPLDTTHKEDGTLNIQLRLWGLIAMGLRMSLAAPCVIGLAYLTSHLENAWMALFTLFLGVPYFICGFPQITRFLPAGYGVAVSECFVGYGLGLIITLTI